MLAIRRHDDDPPQGRKLLGQELDPLGEDPIVVGYENCRHADVLGVKTRETRNLDQAM
jgi:hypothetical protein